MKITANAKLKIAVVKAINLPKQPGLISRKNSLA
jgi:hypothetical protein